MKAKVVVLFKLLDLKETEKNKKSNMNTFLSIFLPSSFIPNSPVIQSPMVALMQTYLVNNTAFFAVTAHARKA